MEVNKNWSNNVEHVTKNAIFDELIKKEIE